MKIHQLLPGFTSGDAISNDVIEIQKLIRGWGHESEIFAVGRHTSPKVRHLCHDYSEYKDYSSQETTVIYHHSIGSVLTQFFKSLPDKKVLIYHNITPDKYFRTINSEKALALYQGRSQLKELIGVPQINLADSEYNCQELKELGFKDPKVLPIILDFSLLAEAPDGGILNRYDDGFTNLLFVGRITPNKKIEDVIKVFYYYRQTVNLQSRLFIAGSFVGMERYYAYLRALVLELNLQNVIFTGHVTQSELNAYYKLSDVFVCMSEHEGFCIPLAESMYFGVPVVAFKAAAVPYTLGGSGVLVEEKDFPKIAELVNLVISDGRVKGDIINGQKKRLDDFDVSKTGEMLKRYLDL